MINDSDPLKRFKTIKNSDPLLRRGRLCGLCRFQAFRVWLPPRRPFMTENAVVLLADRVYAVRADHQLLVLVAQLVRDGSIKGSEFLIPIKRSECLIGSNIVVVVRISLSPPSAAPGSRTLTL